MALNKIRKLDRDSFGVTLPRDDLRVAGLLNDEGELGDEYQAHIRLESSGAWSIEVFEG